MGKYDDLSANGPPLDDTEEDETPFLGVPKSYVATRNVAQDNADQFGPGTLQVPTQVPPTFFKGAEFGPSGMGQEEKAELQLALRAAGLYTKNEKFQLGAWDTNTRNAFKRLLEYANGAGHTDAMVALNEYASAKERFGDTDGEEGETRAPLTIRVSNPLDIRRAADASSRAAIGRRLRPDEIDKLVKSYQALEADEQRGAYNQAETGGTMTAAPDAAAFLTDQAERLDPAGKTEMDTLGVNNAFFDLLDGA